MLIENGAGLPASLFRGTQCEPSHHEATDALRSALIASYELALARGLAPTSALAIILTWSAEECARVHAEGCNSEA